MSSIKNFTAIFAAAVVAIPATITPAFADDRVTFEFNSHELGSSAGVERLYKKIEARAEALCAEARVEPQIRRTQCESDLVNDFVIGIGDSVLSTVHAAATRSDQYAAY